MSMLPPRRHTPPLLLILAATALAVTSGPSFGHDLALDTLTSDLTKPVGLCAAQADTSRVFVLEKDGFIRVIRNGALLDTPFLDLSSEVSTGTEQGLLGLAFHPEYETNRRFFVSFTNIFGRTILNEYAGSSVLDLALPASVRTIFELHQPFAEHNGGHLRFGPEGFLYFGLGDGGGVNNPGNTAQDLSSPLGKLLRFDVDLPAPYIPSSNPFVGTAGHEAVWASGLRNPWGFSFDRVTGDLYIGDVGRGAYEEIDFQPAGSSGGENYGWRCMEGNNCTGLGGCTCDGKRLTPPILTYAHNQGCAVIAGSVYRGRDIPQIQGTYFYADYCTASVYSFSFDGKVLSEFRDRTPELEAALGRPLSQITAFGEDARGELYLLELSGSVHRFRAAGGEPVNYCTALANSTGAPSRISWTGSTSISANNLTLHLDHLPRGPQFTGMFATSPDPVQLALGNGNLCLGTQTLGFIVRLTPSFLVDQEGHAQITLDHYSPPVHAGYVQAGDTWYYQGWHRDIFGFGFNLSDGLQIVYVP